MGTWGVGIYQNDIALDIRDQFEMLVRKGVSAENATEQLLQEYHCVQDDPKECVDFWLALADSQWNLGVLLPEIRKKAVMLIDVEVATVNVCETSPKTVELRIGVLNELRARLFMQQPKQKGKMQHLYKCEWKNGDVYAYRIRSDLAKEKGLDGCFFLIQKVDEAICYPGHIDPIVYFKITDNENLPKSDEEFNKLPYIQVWFTRYEERFWPIDGSRPQEDIAEKSKIKYEVDEYGFLPQFRSVLLFTSKRGIANNLIYVGNFKKTLPPSKEFIPHNKVNITAIPWKKNGESFEIELIKKYCGHNLRELKIYSNE